MNTAGWRKKSLRRGPRLVLKKLLTGQWVFRSLGEVRRAAVGGGG